MSCVYVCVYVCMNARTRDYMQTLGKKQNVIDVRERMPVIWSVTNKANPSYSPLQHTATNTQNNTTLEGPGRKLWPLFDNSRVHV